jgi:hypothetical protein
VERIIGRKVSKDGVCRLCGFEGRLSKTHVPPRAAGNVGVAQRSVEILDTTTGARRLTLGSPSGGGGTRGWWFCRECNHHTEKWEREYVRWVRTLWAAIQEERPRYGQGIEIKIGSADAGAVGRTLWAWMFALDPHMRVFYPAVAAAILNGAACEPPPNRRLLLAATPDARIWLFRRTRDGRDDPSLPYIAVASPPFVVVLAGPTYTGGENYLDVAGWIRTPAQTPHRCVFSLPIIASYDEEIPPEDRLLNEAARRALHLLPRDS